MPSRTADILLVEDSPHDVELALHALRQHCAETIVHVARDGEEALDYLFCRGSFDSRPFGLPRLVLLDLKLPKVDGIEVLEAIRSDPRTNAIPVVVLTSSKEQRDIAASYRLHVNSYIQKPVNFGEFQDTVRQLGFYWLVVNETPAAS
ncbi:MAG TPA: response regulator [Vicinamibacterales bacterium]|jgi:CheY-like chemotaxis protein